jgi:putative transposase
MVHPGRNASAASILNPSRTFFATTGTSMGRRLLQSERNALLLIDVLRSLTAEHRFKSGSESWQGLKPESILDVRPA